MTQQITSNLSWSSSICCEDRKFKLCNCWLQLLWHFVLCVT